MSLKNFTNQELIARMEKLVRAERRITHLLLTHINEIEERKLHLDMGYDGMYSYLTQALGFSDGAAYRRIQSARLLKKIPSVAEKIEDGSLNLTQLTQVHRCLRDGLHKGDEISKQKAISVLQKLENKNSFETTRTLAVELDMPIEIQQKVKPQKDNSIRLEITLTAEQFAELETAKSLLSHICIDGAWSDVIATLAEKFNKKKLGGHTLKVLKVSS